MIRCLLRKNTVAILTLVGVAIQPSPAVSEELDKIDQIVIAAFNKRRSELDDLAARLNKNKITKEERLWLSGNKRRVSNSDLRETLAEMSQRLDKFEWAGNIPYIRIISVGDIGIWANRGNVIQVLGDGQIVMSNASRSSDARWYVFRGFSTSNVVDGAQLTMPHMAVVTDIVTVNGTRCYRLEDLHHYVVRRLIKAPAETTKTETTKAPKVANTPGNIPNQKTLNVLASLNDVGAATKQGAWVMTRDDVLMNTSDLSVITLPVEGSGSYRIELEVNRTNGNEAFMMQIPVGSTAVRLEVSHGGAFSGGRYHGMGLVDGQPASTNKTRVEGEITNGQWQKMKIDVTIQRKKASIETSIAGKTIVNWEGDVDKLSASQGWPATDSKRVGLVVLRSRVSFRNVTITGSGKLMKQ